MLRQRTLASVAAMLIWMGGCPKRQDRQNVVVYVPTPPPAAAPVAPTEKAQLLVIEEPAPPPEPQPQPEEIPAPQNTGRTVTHRRRPAAPATTTPAEPDETTTEASPETPPAEVPTLEPRESSAQHTELRQQYQVLAQDVRQRLDHFNGKGLSSSDRRTLADARTFFVQSKQASANGDFQRALNLARKAGLLLDALE